MPHRELGRGIYSIFDSPIIHSFCFPRQILKKLLFSNALGRLALSQEYLKKITSAKFRGQTACFMGQNQVQLSIWVGYVFAEKNSAPRPFAHETSSQNCLRKCETQKGFAFTDTVISEYPLPQFLGCPIPPSCTTCLEKKKNFRNPGANQRILKAKLIAIYLDCHKQR